jgi:hypothetical protein
MLTNARKREAVRLIDVLEHDETSLARIIEDLDALVSAGGEHLDLIAQAPSTHKAR